jgi:ribosomal protein S18 acetylase RimI-like enzyme
MHETGVVTRPFVEQGFSRHSRLFMVLPLEKATKPAPALHLDIEIRPWSEQDYQPAAAVITSAYRGHVDSEINDQYRTLSGSLRFLNNIVRFPGCGTFDPESSFAAVHKQSRTLIGLILCSRVRQDVGHVTQVCVLPEYRSHGIGEWLLESTTANLQQRKFSLLSLTVTEANARAVELYLRLGFDTKRVFDAFVWEG